MGLVLQRVHLLLMEGQRQSPEERLPCVMIICMKLGLYQRDLLAIDGSKFRAVNSKNNCYNAEALKKKLAWIDEYMAECLKQLDAADTSEPERQVLTPEQVRQAVLDLTQRKDKHHEYLKDLQECGETLWPGREGRAVEDAR